MIGRAYFFSVEILLLHGWSAWIGILVDIKIFVESERIGDKTEDCLIYRSHKLRILKFKAIILEIFL